MRYFVKIRRLAASVGADGCSGVPDFFRVVCDRHDWHYRTHKTTTGKPLSKEWADKHLRSGIRHLSYFGDWSPMAWWRFRALMRLRAAQRAWKGK